MSKLLRIRFSAVFKVAALVLLTGCGGEVGVRVENERGDRVDAQDWRTVADAPALAVVPGEQLRFTFKSRTAGPESDGMAVWISGPVRTDEEVLASERMVLGIDGVDNDEEYDVRVPRRLARAASYLYMSALFTEPMRAYTFRVRLIVRR